MKDQKYGGFLMRLIAYVIDSVIVGVPLVIVSVVFNLSYSMSGLSLFGNSGVQVNEVGSFIFSLILTTITFGLTAVYFIGMEGSKYQATIGKKLIGLKVVNVKGEKITYPQATARYFSKILSGILYIGYIMIALTDKKQGLHDLIASTYVVNVDYIHEGSMGGEIIEENKPTGM